MKLSINTIVLACLLVGGAEAAKKVASMDFVARHIIPAGYRDGTTNGAPDLFGFGFGALERSYYDSKEKIFYGGSEIGFITVSDFSTIGTETGAVVQDFGIPLDDALTDIKVCGAHLFVTTKDDPNFGMLHIFNTSKRAADGMLSEPTLIQSVSVDGVGPDNILVSADCLTVLTANEAEGDYEDELINAIGSVTIFEGPFDNAASPPTKTVLALDIWTDEELLAQNIHLPLSLNAMKYWSAVLADANFTNAINNYNAGMVLEPEYVVWGADEKTAIVNLQENNGAVVIDMETKTIKFIEGYGFEGPMADVVEDDKCEVVDSGMQFLLAADSIASFAVDGVTYIVTANEGDDLEYGDFEERVRGRSIFRGNAIAHPNMTADPAVFDPTDITVGTSKHYNNDCDEANPATPWCSDSMRMSIGSAMIDYSDPTAPFIKKLTGIGGRGISIFKVLEDGFERVWSSGTTLEVEGCKAYPWAHNGLQDEEFAPVNGAFYNSLSVSSSLRSTIDEVNDPMEDGCTDAGDGMPGACPLGQTVDARSLKDGPAPESVVVGEACGQRLMVTVAEKNSIGFVFTVDDVTAPELLQVFHLSEASQTMSPGLAYDAGVIGEIDAESIQFLSAEENPRENGNAAILFSGAWSGTVSLWEFMCADLAADASMAPTDMGATTTTAPAAGTTTAPIASPTAAPSAAHAMSPVILAVIAMVGVTSMLV